MIDTNTVINYKSSFVAGILIGIGVIINTVAPVPVVGPLLFSFGLITIIELQLQLYTGKIGFGFNINLIKVLLGNFIGIGITIGLYILSNPSFYQLLQVSCSHHQLTRHMCYICLYPNLLTSKLGMVPFVNDLKDNFHDQLLPEVCRLT